MIAAAVIIIAVLFILCTVHTMINYVRPTVYSISDSDEKAEVCREFALDNTADTVYTWRRGKDTKGVRVLLADGAYETVYALFDIDISGDMPESGSISSFDGEYESSEEQKVYCAYIDIPGLYDRIGENTVCVFEDDGRFVMEIEKWH